MVKFLVFMFLFLASISSAGTYIPIRSIQPIQRINDDGILTNYCTSWSINKKEGWWVTAAHCINEMNQVDGGKATKVVMFDTNTDLAIYGANRAPALHIAPNSPRTGDEVFITGYPHASLDPITFFGKVANPWARLNKDLTVSIYNVLGLPGVSGAPIVDRSGRVVGVAQNSTQNGAVYGTPFRIVKETLMPYEEQ